MQECQRLHSVLAHRQEFVTFLRFEEVNNCGPYIRSRFFESLFGKQEFDELLRLLGVEKMAGRQEIHTLRSVLVNRQESVTFTNLLCFEAVTKAGINLWPLHTFMVLWQRLATKSLTLSSLLIVDKVVDSQEFSDTSFRLSLWTKIYNIYCLSSFWSSN